MFTSIVAAAIAVAQPSPAASQPAAPAPAVEKSEDQTAAAKMDLSMFQQIFDRMFPPQPDPDPARLALARQSTAALLPNGSYANAMGTMIDRFADGVLNMSEADLPRSSKDKKPPSKETLRQKLVKDDPYFEERMTIMRRVAGEEMMKISAILEPRMREGLARSLSRRLDGKQLTDLNAFLATDSGKAFGRENFAMWIDPDAMRSIIGAMPDLMMAMPNIFKRIEAETAHLPKPKKNGKADTAKEAEPAKSNPSDESEE
nr:hypothetical protein [uncultured Sphingomonas sp.]